MHRLAVHVANALLASLTSKDMDTFLPIQSRLSISSESSEPVTSQLNSEHPLLSQLHHHQSVMGTSDGESDQFSTSSSSPVMLESGSPTEQLPPASHFPWLPPASHVTPNHHHHPFSGTLVRMYTHTHHTHTHTCITIVYKCMDAE